MCSANSSKSGENRQNYYTYTFAVDGKRHSTCKNFLLHKLTNIPFPNENCPQRSEIGTRNIKACFHQKFHTTDEVNLRKHFDDPSLNVMKLYKYFQQYYYDVTDNILITDFFVNKAATVFVCQELMYVTFLRRVNSY
ncbi:hypothetical protein PR048_019939 [Dryococelus australis]|uniref:Uncharacterized protein n=1 Tax=Dryococelus australis TaxID=614101 RepID=A0ABQ9H4V9_9NEOP|nr:hypothetical protein PR048_019939 [Dryococelus australis]